MRNSDRAYRYLRNVGAATVVAAVMAAACSDGSLERSASVTGTEDSCTIATDELAAGKIDFEFTNQGDQVSELYILRANGDVVDEVEFVFAGTTRILAADLVAGEYQAVCKPGMTGDGIGASFEVTGDGGTVQAESDYEITFDAVDFTYQNLDLGGIKSGDTVRFEMTNTGEEPHEFEVLGSDDQALGEIFEVEPGESGGATITFETPGTYTFQCILIEPLTGLDHATLGMIGTFEVQ